MLYDLEEIVNCYFWRTVVNESASLLARAIVVSTLFGMISCSSIDSAKNGTVSNAIMDDLPDFPYTEFRANHDVAKWLIEYDRMAWLSSDVVIQEPQEKLKELGSEWFCVESGGNWHALYGRYDKTTEKYFVVFHYVYHEKHGFVPSTEMIDENTLTVFGRALFNSFQHLPESVANLGVRFNQCIRRLGDSKIEVWILPGGQQDGTLVYGGDIHYIFDANGSELLHEQLNYTNFYSIRPSRYIKLEIEREENDVPSVGDIFFLLSFRDRFDDVMVWTRCFTTKLIDAEGKESAWLHIERPRIECRE